MEDGTAPSTTWGGGRGHGEQSWVQSSQVHNWGRLGHGGGGSRSTQHQVKSFARTTPQ